MNDEWSSDDAASRFEGATGLLFEQAMAQTRMAVCLTDPKQADNPIVFCNRAFERLTGYRQHEIIGRNCRFLQGPKTDQHQVTKIRDAIRTEEVAVVEILNYRKNGEQFWNALHLGPIYDESGSLKYFFGSQWDVTNIHLARAEERHAKALAREISHRLKNVFSVIGGIVNVTGRAMEAKPVARAINERVQALGRAYEPTLDDALLGTVAPTIGSSYDSAQDARFAPLPLNLGEAVAAFRSDEVLRKALGPELADLLVDYRSDEWARFCGYVTDWEKDTYWEDAP